MTRATPENVDAELPMVQAILAGDRGAFEQFVRRQSQWVRGVVFGVLGDSERVDDVCQQVWTTVWQQLGLLKDVERWRSWLYRLARNAAMDAGREVTRRRKLNKAVQEAHAGRNDHRSPDRQAVDQEQSQLVMEALRSLPALYREPFVLRHLQGWSYQEIAELLSMPVDTVETRLVRARRHLRDALQGRIMEPR